MVGVTKDYKLHQKLVRGGGRRSRICSKATCANPSEPHQPEVSLSNHSCVEMEDEPRPEESEK